MLRRKRAVGPKLFSPILGKIFPSHWKLPNYTKENRASFKGTVPWVS